MPQDREKYLPQDAQGDHRHEWAEIHGAERRYDTADRLDEPIGEDVGGPHPARVAEHAKPCRDHANDQRGKQNAVGEVDDQDERAAWAAVCRRPCRLKCPDQPARQRQQHDASHRREDDEPAARVRGIPTHAYEPSLDGPDNRIRDRPQCPSQHAEGRNTTRPNEPRAERDDGREDNETKYRVAEDFLQRAHAFVKSRRPRRRSAPVRLCARRDNLPQGSSAPAERRPAARPPATIPPESSGVRTSARPCYAAPPGPTRLP